ncbi:MAG: GtrA family protein, partial [Beijerinckiaceae bacterium]
RRLTGMPPWACWILSFGVAATSGWLLNRSFTFRADAGTADAGEWARYLLVAGLGAAAHFLVFLLAVAFVPLFSQQPALAIIPGSLASLCVTYIGAALFVFETARKKP